MEAKLRKPAPREGAEGGNGVNCHGQDHGTCWARTCPGTRSAAATLPFPPSPNRQVLYTRPLCSCLRPSWSLPLAAAQCLTHLKELHNPSNVQKKRRKEKGRRREGVQKAAAAPLVFEKEPVTTRAANEASSSLSNARQFLQNMSSGKG